jgi:hypothetical protein
MRWAARRLAGLRPWGRNPRTISDAALKGLGASIDRFGLVQPIVVNERTGRIVGGHQRAKVLEARGVTETDVVLVDLSEDEEAAANLALNSPAIAGEWTADALAILGEVKAALPDLARDLRLPALEVDLGKLFPRTVVEDGAVPEPPAEPMTKPGELVLLGPHRLICGDSTQEDVRRHLLQETTPEVQIVDPPFESDYAQWPILASRMLVVYGRGKSLPPFECACLVGGWGGMDFIFTGPAHGAGGPYLPCTTHERVVVLRRGGKARVWDAMILARIAGLVRSEDGRPMSVQPFGAHEGPGFAGPAMGIRGKNVRGLLLVLAAAPPTPTVLDLTAGSGASLVATQEAGGTWFGAEIEPARCDVIRARWAQVVTSSTT